MDDSQNSKTSHHKKTKQPHAQKKFANSAKPTPPLGKIPQNIRQPEPPQNFEQNTANQKRKNPLERNGKQSTIPRFPLPKFPQPFLHCHRESSRLSGRIKPLQPALTSRCGRKRKTTPPTPSALFSDAPAADPEEPNPAENPSASHLPNRLDWRLLPMNHLQSRGEHRLTPTQPLVNQFREILLIHANPTPAQLLRLNETNGLATLRSEGKRLHQITRFQIRSANLQCSNTKQNEEVAGKLFGGTSQIFVVLMRFYSADSVRAGGSFSAAVVSCGAPLSSLSPSGSSSTALKACWSATKSSPGLSESNTACSTSSCSFE